MLFTLTCEELCCMSFLGVSKLLGISGHWSRQLEGKEQDVFLLGADICASGKMRLCSGLIKIQHRLNDIPFSSHSSHAI